MLATALTEPSSEARAKAPHAADALPLAGALIAAAALFLQGGVDLLVGACVGAILGATTTSSSNDRLPAALAGLFAGALCTAFFHTLLFAFS